MKHSQKERAIALRKKGFSYTEIRTYLPEVPKSTLSGWVRGVVLSEEQVEANVQKQRVHLASSREKSVLANKKRREARDVRLFEQNLPLLGMLEDKNIAKIALAMLYLGEGGKYIGKASMDFCNSDPETVRLFLRLFRACYPTSEEKFRCTVQCRADQDTGELVRFWMGVTGIRRPQFYRPQIDPRTLGKPSKKVAYKGVCRIDYFSSEIFFDLLQTMKVLKGR